MSPVEASAALQPIGEDDADLALADAYAAGHAAWPGVEVSAETFGAYLSARVNEDAAAGGESDRASGIRKLHTSDLYLACACNAQNPKALAAFEARFAEDIKRTVVRLMGSSAREDEVLQLLRTKLFVATPPNPSAIARYGGRSGLRTWLHATTGRLVLNLVGRAGREVAVTDSILEALPSAGGDPELEYIKQRYASEFGAALSDAVAALTVRERNLLRHAFADGLSVDRIGELYGVHRATAGRWVQSARQSLFVELRKSLGQRLRLPNAELESIVRLVQSRLDVSLHRLLGE